MELISIRRAAAGITAPWERVLAGFKTNLRRPVKQLKLRFADNRFKRYSARILWVKLVRDDFDVYRLFFVFNFQESLRGKFFAV